MTVLDLFSTCVHHWRAMIATPLLLTALVLGASFVVTPTYTATTTFVPESRSAGNVGQLASLAGQLGISIPTGTETSSRFYADVLTSRQLLDELAAARYPLAHPLADGSDSASLLQLLHVKGGTPAQRLENARRKLVKVIAADADAQTNVVRVGVDAADPVAAAAVANHLIAELNIFNQQRRQSNARQRREFIEGRVVATGKQLRQAENDLATWLQNNKTYQSSPVLEAEYQRLRRAVDIQQEIYLTLNRDYETARIDELNGTDVITVIDSAVPPQRASKPNRTLWVILAFMLGGTAGIVVVLLTEFMERARAADPAAFVEFDRLRQRLRPHQRPPKRSRAARDTAS